MVFPKFVSVVISAAEIQAELEQEETKSVENVAQIKHRERNYMGMLEYKKDDEGAVIKCLILGKQFFVIYNKRSQTNILS